MNSIIIIALISSSYVHCFDRIKWPEGFKVAPIINSWTTRALKDANIPDVPPRAPYSPTITSPSDITGCNDQNTWALTYDDGPGPFTVDNALKPLKDRNIKATFFVTGQQVAMYPEILKQIYDDGHSIGIHTWSHKGLSTLTNSEIISEIVWTAAIIKDVIGVVPTYMRPPYIDPRSRAVIQALGLKIVMWNVDTNDWRYEGYTSDNKNLTDPSIAIPEYIRNQIQLPHKGTISLQHDLSEIQSRQITPILGIVQNASYSIQTIPECANFAPYDATWLDRIISQGSTSDGLISDGLTSDELKLLDKFSKKPSKSKGFLHKPYLSLIVVMFLFFQRI